MEIVIISESQKNRADTLLLLCFLFKTKMWVCRAKRGTPTVKSFQEIALRFLLVITHINTNYLLSVTLPV